MSSETTPLVATTTTTTTTVDDDLHPPTHSTTGPPALASQQKWTTLFGYLQLILLVFFFTATKLQYEEKYSTEEYIIFRDIMVMLLLGFGYLMTFLSEFGLGAVGYVTLDVDCIVL
jgi:hypothetical protein